jgi:hypothetical protein
LAIHIGKMTWCTILHMVFPCLTISSFQQQYSGRYDLLMIQNHTTYSHIQCGGCCMLQVNNISWIEYTNLRSITSSMNCDILNNISVLNNCQILHTHMHHPPKQNNSLFTCLNPHCKIIETNYNHIIMSNGG